MVIKAKDLLGKKVLSIHEGKFIEDVDDVVYDPQANEIKALIVDKGGWFSDTKIVLFDDVKKIGKDAVIVEDEDVMKKVSEVGEQIEQMTQNGILSHAPIVTEEGKKLGTISDLFFDDTTGKVTELEVSQGFKDFQSGKIRVKVSDVISVGRDATIVRNYNTSSNERPRIHGRLPKKVEDTITDKSGFLELFYDRTHDLTEPTLHRSLSVTNPKEVRQ
jgi:uncharacterized protein YrrD